MRRDTMGILKIKDQFTPALMVINSTLQNLIEKGIIILDGATPSKSHRGRHHHLAWGSPAVFPRSSARCGCVLCLRSSYVAAARWSDPRCYPALAAAILRPSEPRIPINSGSPPATQIDWPFRYRVVPECPISCRPRSHFCWRFPSRSSSCRGGPRVVSGFLFV